MLSVIQKQAKNVFSKMGYPQMSDENWRYTNINSFSNCNSHIKQSDFKSIDSGKIDSATNIILCNGQIAEGIDKNIQGLTLLNLEKRNSSMGLAKFSQISDYHHSGVIAHNTSEFTDVDKLFVYSSSLEFIKEIKLKEVLPQGIQGGAFFNDDLYLTANERDNVIKVDVETGEWDVIITNLLTTKRGREYKYEMEGITFMDLRDKGMGQMHFFGNHMINKRVFHFDKNE